MIALPGRNWTLGRGTASWYYSRDQGRLQLSAHYGVISDLRGWYLVQKHLKACFTNQWTEPSVTFSMPQSERWHLGWRKHDETLKRVFQKAKVYGITSNEPKQRRMRYVWDGLDIDFLSTYLELQSSRLSQRVNYFYHCSTNLPQSYHPA